MDRKLKEGLPINRRMIMRRLGGAIGASLLGRAHVGFGKEMSDSQGLAQPFVTHFFKNNPGRLIAIQTLGAERPSWSSFGLGPHQPMFEIVIAHKRGLLTDKFVHDGDRRLVVRDETLADFNVPAALVIDADAKDVDVVAEALTWFLNMSNLAIGADEKHLELIYKSAIERRARGAVLSYEQVLDPVSVERTCRSLVEAGFDGNTFIMFMVGEQYEDTFDLYDIEDIACMIRPSAGWCIVAGAWNTERFAVVILRMLGVSSALSA